MHDWIQTNSLLGLWECNGQRECCEGVILEKTKMFIANSAWYDEPRVWEFPFDGCLDAQNKVHGLLHTFIHLCVAFSSKAVINLFISYNSVMGLYEYDEVPLRLDTVP